TVEAAMGLEYWLKWHVGVCGLIIFLPATGAAMIGLKRRKKMKGDDDFGVQVLRRSDLWLPCWKNLNPVWLLVYRVSAFGIMGWLLYQTVLFHGIVAFVFYTQWTFALVMIYFAIGAIISAQGCMRYTKSAIEVGEKGKSSQNGNAVNGLPKHHLHDETYEDAGFWGHLMHIIYQTCAGAVLMTDIVFWCVLVPMLAGKTFEVTWLIGSIHAVNVVFLLIDSALNRLPFPLFGFIYFIYWGVSYIIFQWLLHAFSSITWWPYPFLDLSTAEAPLWYLGLALFHIPCFWIYLMIMNAKAPIFSRYFPKSFVRSHEQVVHKKAA
ncbi:hypothetical protein Drorol1_Dr00022303, partial [Drosera rotundifolia]